jgi:hypothetical protein
MASKYKNEGLQIPAPSPFHRTVTELKIARLQEIKMYQAKQARIKWKMHRLSRCGLNTCSMREIKQAKQ